MSLVLIDGRIVETDNYEVVSTKAMKGYFNQAITYKNETEEFFVFDNIGIGASSSSDFNYMCTIIYKDENDIFYVEDSNYEDEWRGQVSDCVVLDFMLWSYNKFMCEKTLKLILENREIFESCDENLFEVIGEEDGN